MVSGVNRTDRLVGMLLELQARGSVRAEDLAQHFEVSVRTVYRDLEALSETGVPLVATPGKGFQLMDGYFLPPLAFAASEAALLVLGTEFIRRRVDPELRTAAETALAKLQNVLPAEQRQTVERWRSEILFPAGQKADDPRLTRLREAIQQRRVVRVVYHAFRKAEPEARDIEPVQLLYMSERWHVGAYCRLRNDMRLFRLDRIDRFSVLGEQFTLDARHVRPSGSEDWKADAAEVRVRFHPSVERWVRERQPFTFLREEHDDRGPVFVYGIRREDDLVRWLLAWGASAEVLSPPHLRARLAAEIYTMFSRYAGAPDIGVSTAHAQAGVEA
jgi:predicted DNA-binding transcriptional regulator YafY